MWTTSMSPAVMITWCVIMFHTALVDGVTPCRRKQVATFNTGLTPYVPNYTKRRDTIPQHLEQTQADVVCFQEVWFERDMKTILEKLGKAYPYTWSPLHFSTTPLQTSTPSIWSSLPNLFRNLLGAPCQSLTFYSLGWCALSKCSKSSLSLIACLVGSCSDKVFALSQTCLTCIVISNSNVRSTLVRCFGMTLYHDNKINLEGLMILSKSRITSARHQWYIPNAKQMTPRGFIEVQVYSYWEGGSVQVVLALLSKLVSFHHFQIEDFGTVVCTHLTGTLAARPGLYIEAQIHAKTGIASWEELQEFQIKYLTSTLKHHLLAGDFNTGPAVPRTNVNAEFPNNYALFTDGGYYNEYISRGEASCTFSSSSHLIQTNSSSILDHIPVKEVTTEVTVCVPGEMEVSPGIEFKKGPLCC